MGNAKYIFGSLLFVTIAVGLCYLAVAVTSLEWPLYHIIAFLIGSVAVVSLLTSATCLFISTQRIAKHHSIFSALQLFVIKHHRLHDGSRRLREMRATFKTPREAQEKFLRYIIRKNKKTDYGRRFKLGEISSLNDFREKHPLCDYDRYEDFVSRVGKGEENVMTTERVTRLVSTSGTTGKSKLIPQDERAVENMLATTDAFQREVFPDLGLMQSSLKIHTNGAIRRSVCGLPICAGTAVEKFMVDDAGVYTPPGPGQLISSVREAFYIDLLFALRDKELGSAIVPFTPTIVDLVHFLEDNWRDLVKDLAVGSLKADLDLSLEARTSLLKSLGSGDPQRAAEVQTECEKGSDGIMKRLWPNMKVITAIDNAGIRRSLKESVAKGIEIHSALYAGSEAGLFGFNLWPFDDGVPEYVLNVAKVIYEFIKEDDMHKPNPPTYFIDEVEVGQRYELVLSQQYGIYRFRFGDVIEVSGFHQNCPKVKVLYRKATLLNLVGEKVDQLVVKEAVDSALDKWKGKVALVYYCVAESIIIPGSMGLHYVFFLELKSVTGDRNLPKDLTDDVLGQEIEKGIYDGHSFYQNFRGTCQITPAKAHITRPGAFVKLKEYILSHTAATRTQFKMPVKLRTEKYAEVMLQNLLDQHTES